MGLRPARRRTAFLIAACLVPLALAACSSSSPPPVTFTPLSYSYLPVLRLKVASIEVQNDWQPNATANHLESLSPVTPLAALRTMAKDRLAAGGTSGKATFTIEDASIVGTGSELEGDFAVRLSVLSGGGAKSGSINARVSRTAPEPATSGPALRAALYNLVRTMMNTMNVDFEFQLRRSLGSWLLSGPAGIGTPVQAEPLAAPGLNAGAAPAPTGLNTPGATAPSAGAVGPALGTAPPAPAASSGAAPSGFEPKPGVLGTLPLPLHAPAP